MGTLAAYTTPYGVHPYLTLGEYKNAPTAVDVSNLVPGGVQAAQDAELGNVILRASSYIDTFCSQVLAATLDIETKQLAMDRRGYLRIHPDFWPIREVRDVQYGAQPNQMVSIPDITNVWIEKQMLSVSLLGSSSTWSGSLGFSAPRPGQPLFVRYSYVNGWPDTTLVSGGTVSSTSIVVPDATGIYGGTSVAAGQLVPARTALTIYDGANTETITVSAVNGNTLTVSALVNAHSAGVSVSALPAAVKQAAILVTSSLIKTRGDEALVMDAIDRPGRAVAMDPTTAADLRTAFDLLRPYRRIR